MRAFGEDDDGDESDEGVAAKDDESVSDDGSDIGWDSDDEIAFGKVVNKSKNIGKEEEEELPEDDELNSDDDGDMLLSDMLTNSKSAPIKTINSKEEHEHDDDKDEEDDEEERGRG